MMKFSYKKLFKKLIDLEMKSTELMDKAQISKSTFYKIKNGQNAWDLYDDDLIKLEKGFIRFTIF